MEWQSVGRSTRAELGSGQPCCAAVPVPPPPVPPDRCDGHCCAGMSSSGSGTQTASRRLIIPNKAASAWKQSCRQPPKARCDSVSPSMPRLFDSLVRWNLSARDIALRAGEGRQPLARLRSNCQVGGRNSSGSFMPAEGVPSSPTSPQTAKRGLEQEEAAMTDVPTEHQGEPKRRKEQEVADSSSSEETS